MKLPLFFPGFLLVIEGIDGTGKSTQAQVIAEILQRHHIPVLRTREPTNGRWGQLLRDSATTGRLSIEEEVELFIKDRREHVTEKIVPALREGKIVIIDRYYFSTAAYQGARGLDPNELIRRNEEFAPEPDLLVLLDLEVTHGLERINARGDRANHFEQTQALQRAREIFLGINKPYLRKIDARQDAKTVSRLILREFVARYADCMAEPGLTLESERAKAIQSLRTEVSQSAERHRE